MQLQERIKEMADNGYVEYRSYSGRGMYGKSCVGITGSYRDCQRLLSDIAAEIIDDVYTTAIDCGDDEKEMIHAGNVANQSKEDIENLMNYSTDNMGLDIVMYWPNIKFVGKEFEDEEDEE